MLRWAKPSSHPGGTVLTLGERQQIKDAGKGIRAARAVVMVLRL